MSENRGTQKSVEVIVPVYDGAKYLPRLFDSLELQRGQLDFSVRILLTSSHDDSEQKIIERGYPYEAVQSFNHALTREEAIMSSNKEVVVLLTQDVFFTESDALRKLIDSMTDGIAISYLRQKGSGIGVERYVRHCNYPKKSETRDASIIEGHGLDAFFCSDACMAYDVATFKKLDGFDGKALPTNEDMYYARKVLLAGYKIHYCAESFVYHCHHYTLKSLYHRYEKYGVFLRKNPEFLEYSSQKSGIRLAWSVCWRILVTLNFFAAFCFIPNMLARYLGLKNGRKDPAVNK